MRDNSNRRTLLSAVAVFIFVYVYDMLVHGHLLMDLYLQTANVWRPESDMRNMMPVCLIVHLALALIITWLFSKYDNANAPKAKGGQKACEKTRGLNFGLCIGLILGLTQAMAYVSLPIPPALPVAWFIASVVKGLGIGLILSYTMCHKVFADK